ncbi:unnamed protein product [Sphagnum troendelagicum]
MEARVPFEVHQLHPDRFHRLRIHRLSKPDHKLTLIFFSSLFGVGLEGPWIKRGDPTVIWPRDWLPKEEEGLGDNILVLSVLCNLRGNQFWVDIGKTVLQELVMEYVCSHLNALLGSFLGAFVSSGSTCDLIMLPVCFPVTKWQLDRPQTIVLVGHGVGGFMLKSFTMEVDKVSKVDKANGELQQARCKAFQQNIKGIVFYSVPHTTSKEECANYGADYWKSYLDKHMSWLFFQFPKQFSQNMASLNVGFEKSIEQQHINLLAFVAGHKVSISESSTYKLTRNNVCKIEDANCFQVCEPLDQQHDSYKRLLQFIQEALDVDELRLQQFNTKFNLKDSQGLDDQSISIGLSSVIQKPHLPRKAKQKVKTSNRTNEMEGVPSQQQKLDVMIRTIDVHIKSPKDLRDLTPKEVLGKTSILCVGGKAMEGDSGEFLFMDVGDMAKVVGVGLDWAKVVVTKEFGVDVIQEDEGEWTKLWCLEHFVPRIITIPSPKQELMTHPNSTKTDGVELEANLGRVYVEDDKEKIAHACFPQVFELAEHIGLGRKNAMKTKEVSGAESSGSTKGIRKATAMELGRAWL